MLNSYKSRCAMCKSHCTNHSGVQCLIRINHDKLKERRADGSVACLCLWILISTGLLTNHSCCKSNFAQFKLQNMHFTQHCVCYHFIFSLHTLRIEHCTQGNVGVGGRPQRFNYNRNSNASDGGPMHQRGAHHMCGTQPYRSQDSF